MKGLNILHIEVGLDRAMLIAYFRGYMNGEEDFPLYKKYAHMADGYDIIVGYITGESSKEIYKQANAATMNTNYFVFHTVDVQLAIEWLKELKK